MKKNLTKIISILVAFFLMTGIKSEKMGGYSGNGGDEIAIDFQHSLKRAVATLSTTYPELSTVLKRIELENASVKVVVVNKPLYVTAINSTQESVAVNYADKKLILIHRKRWMAIQDQRTKDSIALHEHLSLIGIESSGYYPISSLLFNSNPSEGVIYRVGCQGTQLLGFGECMRNSQTCRPGDQDLGSSGCRWNGASNKWNAYSCEHLCATQGPIKSHQTYSRFSIWINKSDSSLTPHCRPKDLDLGVICSSTVIWRSGHGGNCERQCLTL